MPVPYSANAPFTPADDLDELAVVTLDLVADVFRPGDTEMPSGDVGTVPREFALGRRRGGEDAALQAAGRGNLHRILRNRLGFLLRRGGERKEERQKETGHHVRAFLETRRSQSLRRQPAAPCLGVRRTQYTTARRRERRFLRAL
jgi:hypothetical protein